MKKLLLLFAGIFMFTLVSCGPSEDDLMKICQKIEYGVQPSQKDYEIMLDYCFDAREDYLKLRIKAKKDSWTDEKYEEELIDLMDDYPFADVFTRALRKADLNKKNKELKEKYDNKIEKLEDEL